MIATNKIFSVLCFLTFLGCNSRHPENPQSIILKPVSGIVCVPYFHFDKIDHYYLNIAEDKLWFTEQKKFKTSKEKKQLDILIDYSSDEALDTTVLKGIEKLDFIKSEIPSERFEAINEVFCERKHKVVALSACIPVYRDILIFKKEDKIVGTAKLCFSCNQSVIAGTKLNTEEFGQSGDYKKLYKLLHSQE